MRKPLPTMISALVFLGGCASESTSGEPGTAARAETASKPATARSIIDKLKARHLGLTNVATQTEDTDPNNMLGRPNGYTSRASADLPGGDTFGSPADASRGLVVEVFADAAGAKARSEYVQGLQKASHLFGSEWDYTADHGRALIRVSGKVKPSLARKVEAEVAKL